MPEKFKRWLSNDQIYLAGVIILVAAGAFALGRYTVPSSTLGGEGVAVVAMSYTTPVELTQSTSTTSTADGSTEGRPAPPPTPPPEASSVVASKSGTKYHLPSCAGAKQIKPQNKITFPSREAAEAAGYTKAANCKGL